MNIERMLMDEIREKKRIGSNIFSRASTRKGGSNRALRTPYFYMSRRERKRLNGEVKVYKMIDMISYNEFNVKSIEEQRELMTSWRGAYKAQKIQDELGIDHNVFYKILDRLELPKEANKKVNSLVLAEDELKLYSKELLEFPSYRELPLEQQSILLESYIKKYGSVSKVAKEWEIDGSYLYHVRSKFKKVKGREKAVKVENKKVNKNKSPKVSTEIKETDNSLQEVSDDQSDIGAPSTNMNQAISQVSQDELVKNTVELLTKVGYFREAENETAEAEKELHSSDIEINTNSFSFNLKGAFNSQTIKKRLEMALDVIDDETELLNLEIKISNRQ